MNQHSRYVHGRYIGRTARILRRQKEKKKEIIWITMSEYLHSLLKQTAKEKGGTMTDIIKYHLQARTLGDTPLQHEYRYERQTKKRFLFSLHVDEKEMIMKMMEEMNYQRGIREFVQDYIYTIYIVNGSL